MEEPIVLNIWGYLLIALLSMAPALEVRASIPLGVYMGLDPIVVLLVSYVSGLMPGIILIYGLSLVEKASRGKPIIGVIFTRFLKRVRVKARRISRSRYIYVALALFVAIPLPGTGVWTGGAAAYILGLDKRRSIISVAIGNMIASILVLAASLGILEILKTFL